MSTSAFFRNLHVAYQAEIDDLATDSEGRHVLPQRLAQRRGELGFLLQMLELSPEMVAVVFHQGFQFRLPAVMSHLLTHDADELPDWDSLADCIEIRPGASALAQRVLQEPAGPWFMTVAAALEYMHSTPGFARANAPDDDNDEASTQGDRREDAGQAQGENQSDDFVAQDDDAVAQQRDEAGADWLAEQGFDRKD